MLYSGVSLCPGENISVGSTAGEGASMLHMNCQRHLIVTLIRNGFSLQCHSKLYTTTAVQFTHGCHLHGQRYGHEIEFEFEL